MVHAACSAQIAARRFDHCSQLALQSQMDKYQLPIHRLSDLQAGTERRLSNTENNKRSMLYDTCKTYGHAV